MPSRNIVSKIWTTLHNVVMVLYLQSSIGFFHSIWEHGLIEMRGKHAALIN